MPNLRSDLIRIASELPQGDPSRREILAALKSGATMSDYKKDMGKLDRVFRKLGDAYSKAMRENSSINEHIEYAAYSSNDFHGDAGPEHDQGQVMELGANILAKTRPAEKKVIAAIRKFKDGFNPSELSSHGKRLYKDLEDELRDAESKVKVSPRDWKAMSEALRQTGTRMFQYAGALLSRLVEDVTGDQF
jgi:hypothetical protein